ncbi:uncharacterized protein LOC120249057 [Hyaena hyaena]|uniref:uncharacterized protein LOC120249057 n=1 Tax=Hyaena hyaena TaxID=95912 RepID=UPI0019251044|nr:uncharacterized protein LOC120249057 [Hyaena hyaena]
MAIPGSWDLIPTTCAAAGGGRQEARREPRGPRAARKCLGPERPPRRAAPSARRRVPAGALPLTPLRRPPSRRRVQSSSPVPSFPSAPDRSPSLPGSPFVRDPYPPWIPFPGRPPGACPAGSQLRGRTSRRWRGAQARWVPALPGSEQTTAPRASVRPEDCPQRGFALRQPHACLLPNLRGREPPKVFLKHDSSWRVLRKLFKVKMNTDSKEVLPMDVQAPEVWEELTVKVETESHLWMQASRLKRSSPLAREVFQRRFRQLCYQETPGPREALTHLWELCRQWLSPETRTKEQIQKLLVLEQFLTILPAELQARVWEHHLESGEEAVILLEDLEKELDEPQLEMAAYRQG